MTKLVYQQPILGCLSVIDTLYCGSGSGATAAQTCFTGGDPEKHCFTNGSGAIDDHIAACNNVGNSAFNTTLVTQGSCIDGESAFGDVGRGCQAGETAKSLSDSSYCQKGNNPVTPT